MFEHNLTEREESNPTAIASNQPFSGWTRTFTDPRLCAAIIDRLTFAREHPRDRHPVLPPGPRPQLPGRLTGERPTARRQTMTQMVAHLLPRFWSVGASTADLGTAQLSYRRGLESEPTATFLHRLRTTTGQELTATLARAHEITGTPCPRAFLDDDTPAQVEATLVAWDWQIDAVLQLMLPVGAALPSPDVADVIRPAETTDWNELAALFRADHEEEDRKSARPVRPDNATRRVVAARKQLHDPVRYFVAIDDGIAGFVAAWPGEHGTGLVEDLFVRTGNRGQKLATALIAHAVTWARTRGAEAVVIGAEPDDTPSTYTRAWASSRPRSYAQQPQAPEAGRLEPSAWSRPRLIHLDDRDGLNWPHLQLA